MSSLITESEVTPQPSNEIFLRDEGKEMTRVLDMEDPSDVSDAGM